jgi:recombination protein RecA
MGGFIDVGLELGALNKKGSFIYLGDTIIGQGREAARAFLKENHKVAKQIEDAIWKIVKDTKHPLPKQVGEAEPEE